MSNERQRFLVGKTCARLGWSLRVALTVLGLAGAPLHASADMVDDLWHQAPPQTDRLGLAFPNDDPGVYGTMAEMGMGIVRVSASWGRIGGEEYDFSGLDYRLRALGEVGIAGFVTFESDHRWLARHTRKVKNGTPRNLARWGAFVEAVVERYDGDGIDDMPGLIRPVAYVQAANEFLRADNRSGGWAGSDAALVDYLWTTYEAVKRADPEMPVVLGGIAAFNMDIALIDAGVADIEVRQNWSETSRTVITAADIDTRYHRDALRRLNHVLDNAPYDLVDIHLYGPEIRDATRIDWMARRSGRPVLSAECGGPSTDYGEEYTGHRHFIAVLERNLGVLASGGQVCLWFGLTDRLQTSYSNRHTPLFEADMMPKPAVAAYRALGALLSDGGNVARLGPRFFSIETNDGLICAAFGGDKTGVSVASCGGERSICVVDAATRKAQSVALTDLSAACPGEAVALAGAGLPSVLKRNRLR